MYYISICEIQLQGALFLTVAIEKDYDLEPQFQYSTYIFIVMTIPVTFSTVYVW